MNFRKKLFIMILFQICFLFLLLPAKSYAADVTVSSLDEMKPYIETAMESYQTSYTLTYTGESLIKASQWNTFFNGILNADGNDYLCNVLKSRAYKQVGVKGNYTITFTFAYWETAEQVAAVDAKVDEVLTSLNVSGMNDYAKERAIHDWIISNVSYDSSLKNHSAYAAITSPNKTVCQGYALLAYKMFIKAGLPARIVTGKGNGTAHAWNLVKVDGNWYQIDLTWDDPVTNGADDIRYDYYNLTDAEMAVNHKWTNIYPAATTEFADALEEAVVADSANQSIYNELTNVLNLYYQQDAYTCSTNQDIQYMAFHSYLDGQNKISFRFTNKSSLSTNIKAAMKSLGFITSYKYTVTDYPRTVLKKDVIVDLTFNTTTPTRVSDFTYSDGSTEHEELQLVLGGKTATLTTTIAPANASTKTIIWSSSDTSVATVSNGVVKATGGGRALITARALDSDKTLSCYVTVTAYVKRIKFDKSALPITIGQDDVQLTTIFTPASATNKELVWTSSNTNIATVSDGKVHAVATGKAVIKATSADGSKVASCTVTVYNPSTGITISNSNITVKLGKKITLKATVAPTTAYKVASWKSSDESIAKVSITGVVIPVSVGKATITATTSDGANSITCEVTVIQGVTSLKLDKTKVTMAVGGEDQTLTATIAPTNATIQTVTWTSSNPKVATVDENGVVHAVSAGTAVIRCTSTQDSSKVAKCTVTVTKS